LKTDPKASQQQLLVQSENHRKQLLLVPEVFLKTPTVFAILQMADERYTKLALKTTV
jgi:hypothetical protein